MSSGLECDIIERAAGQWYYMLQNGDCPVSAWDWREYATAYGPFATQELAEEHLQDNHSNPGGWNEYSLIGKEPGPVLEERFRTAVRPTTSRRDPFSRQSPYRYGATWR